MENMLYAPEKEYSELSVMEDKARVSVRGRLNKVNMHAHQNSWEINIVLMFQLWTSMEENILNYTLR